MNTKSISFIDTQEDSIDLEVQTATTRTIEENMLLYFQSIAAQCAMMNIDIRASPNTRKIYYIEDEHK